MVNSKNSLNLSSKNKTNDAFKKSISLRPQVDGIVKKGKNKIFVTKNIVKEVAETKVEKIPEVIVQTIPETETNIDIEKSSIDDSKRLFFKVAGVAGLGLAASALFPKSSEAYVSGSTPTSNVVGIKSIDNTRINPATAEGQGIEKFSINLLSSNTVLSPTSGKKLRVYATRFSLTADTDSVSFRFASGGTDHEKYVSPKTGGLYGANNHPNYIEGGTDQVLYCAISGPATTVQINIDYLEV